MPREDVIRLREMAAVGRLNPAEMAAQYGYRTQTIRRAIRGETHADVPGAIPDYDGNEWKRHFADEVVLFMRLQWAVGISSKTIARAYGVNPSVIVRAIKGMTYCNVPEPQDTASRKGKVRSLSEDDVMRIRRMYNSRQVSTRQLGLEYGLNRAAISNIVRGYTYKELPGAVPEHVKFDTTHPLRLAKVQKRKREQSQLEALPS